APLRRLPPVTSESDGSRVSLPIPGFCRREREPIRHLPGAGGGSMKVRGATTGTPFAARLTALCWGALTLLAPVAISACTSSSSTTTPTTISPTGTGTASASAASGTSASSSSTSPTGTPGVASDTSTAQPVVTVTQTI